METEIKNLTLKGIPVQNMGSCKNLNDSCCQKCGKNMTHSLLDHDLYRMYTLVSCSNHPLVVWEDCFDKDGIDTSQDWTNKDERFN